MFILDNSNLESHKKMNTLNFVTLNKKYKPIFTLLNKANENYRIKLCI